MARSTTTKSTTRTKGDNGGNGKHAQSAAALHATPAKRSSWRQVTDEERHQMIQFAAYMKAEKRGFQHGDPMADWVEAEHEVDAWLKSQNAAHS